MNNEEIIRIIIDELKDGYIACGEQGYKLLRASLEKQIPKKPIAKECFDFEAYYNSSNPDDELENCKRVCWACGRCGFITTEKHQLYCSNCGQRIDWSEME